MRSPGVSKICSEGVSFGATDSSGSSRPSMDRTLLIACECLEAEVQRLKAQLEEA